MCSLRKWLIDVCIRQRRPLPIVALWPCPDSRKPEVQVEPSKFTISKEPERVGIHLPACPSAHRSTQSLSCYPVGKCFIPDTAVVRRVQMRGSSTRQQEAGPNQPQSVSTAATAHQFCFL